MPDISAEQTKTGMERSARHEKDLEVGLLLDHYGMLLSDSKREAAELYYDDDLSLAEIAENTGITRQGVRDNIEKAKEQLCFFEKNLGLAEKFRQNSTLVDMILKRLDVLREGHKELCGEIDTLSEMIKKISI